MHRPEKEIRDPTGIAAVLDIAPILRTALNDNDAPYILPLCFVRMEDVLYCHTAITGKKLDLIARDPRIGFEDEAEAVVVPGEMPCRFGMRYRSVIGTGETSIVMDQAEKRLGLDLISGKYAGYVPADYPNAELEQTQVIRIAIIRMTGKASQTCGYPL